ncbi:MAG TPA: hypothetical protein VJJ22_00070 [Candidatus Paceibacterota bacterium]
MTVATSTLIKLPKQAVKDGVVVLSMKEYRELQMKAVPTYCLTGKKALALDKLVNDGLRDHKAGKTIKASSMLEALSMYDKRQLNRKKD